MTTLTRGRDTVRILLKVAARGRRVGLGQLGDQGRPGEVLGAEAGAGAGVVVLAQALPLDRPDHAAREALRGLPVAEPAQPEPDQPGRVDPGRAAPVAAQR